MWTPLVVNLLTSGLLVLLPSAFGPGLPEPTCDCAALGCAPGAGCAADPVPPHLPPPDRARAHVTRPQPDPVSSGSGSVQLAVGGRELPRPGGGGLARDGPGLRMVGLGAMHVSDLPLLN